MFSRLNGDGLGIAKEGRGWVVGEPRIYHSTMVPITVLWVCVVTPMS